MSHQYYLGLATVNMISNSSTTRIFFTTKVLSTMEEDLYNKNILSKEGYILKSLQLCINNYNKLKENNIGAFEYLNLLKAIFKKPKNIASKGATRKFSNEEKSEAVDIE
ncbi:hypothetical protein AAHE18_16G085300 [Arachis hypogaea]|nr:uncharacterized protein DS421_16g535570 [Arachis hypogaea]